MFYISFKSMMHFELILWKGKVCVQIHISFPVMYIQLLHGYFFEKSN